MPYIPKKEPPYSRVARLLMGYGMNVSSLSNVLECSWVTAKKRLQCPETFTLMELTQISNKVHIPFDEIREAIRR